MRPFTYARAATAPEAVEAAGPDAMFLAGGTTVLDLMKLDVWRPGRLIDITRLDAGRHSFVERRGDGLRVGALTPMATLADTGFVRETCPVLTDSLWLAASAQLRNMARLGGNVLQRTRCPYYRDTSYAECNKRSPGSGCAALDGANRHHAVLGVSDSCIATYPGDWAQALVALDAVVEVLGKDGPRALRFGDLHLPPGDTPHVETALRPGDLITAFMIPDARWPRSVYLKVRDRESYAYALASAAVALRMEGDAASDVRIALGGVASVPWRAREAEAMLRGGPIDEATATRAAAAAFAGAAPREHNRYKIELGRRTLVRALLTARAMEA